MSRFDIAPTTESAKENLRRKLQEQLDAYRQNYTAGLDRKKQQAEDALSVSRAILLQGFDNDGSVARLVAFLQQILSGQTNPDQERQFFEDNGWWAIDGEAVDEGGERKESESEPRVEDNEDSTQRIAAEVKRKIEGLRGVLRVRSNLGGVVSEDNWAERIEQIYKELSLLFPDPALSEEIVNQLIAAAATLRSDGQIKFESENRVENPPDEQNSGSSLENIDVGTFYLGENIDRSKLPDYGEFLRRIGCPEREVGENIRDYLARLYPALLNRALIYFWNKSEDTAASSPRTKDYRTDPMYGPNSKVNLLNARLIYLEKDTTEVYHFEAFLDQFKSLFFDQDEKKAVVEFTSRWKGLFAEMDVLHNRAVVRREGNNPNGPGYDPTGPAGALAGLENLQKEEGVNLNRIFPSLTEYESLPLVEKEFLNACEFCMGLWSAMILKRKDRVALWPHMSANVRSFFEEVRGPGGLLENIKVKQEFSGVLPIINGRVASKQLPMIERMIEVCMDMMSSVPDQNRTNMAKLAYHAGEAFRIGTGMEAFFDVAYDNPRNPGVATVVAQDGEAKLANFGAYVESNNAKGIRTKYIDVYGKKLFHLYVPLPIYLQYNHDLSIGVSRINDGRASLASLLAIDGGVFHIDWRTGVNAADASVAKMAIEANMGFWELSSVGGAIKNKSKLMWDPTSDFQGHFMPFLRDKKIVAALDHPRRKNAERREVIWKAFGGNRYTTTSEAISMAFKCTDTSKLEEEDAERIKSGILKHAVDYYMGTWFTTYSGDFIRVAEFMFSRDDRPDSDFLVNDRVKGLFFDNIDTNNVDSWSKKLSKRLAAYLLFDVNMAVTAWLNTPKFSENDAVVGRNFDFDVLYDELDSDTIDGMEVGSPSGRVLHTKQIEALVNRMLVIRDHPDFEALFRSYRDAGYSLNPDSSSATIFSREDLLRFLQQEALLAVGKKWTLTEETTKRGVKRNLFILDNNGVQKTAQDYVDRQIVIKQLFGDKK